MYLIFLTTITAVLCQTVVKEGMFSGRHTYNTEGTVKIVRNDDNGRYTLQYRSYIQSGGPQVFQYVCPAAEPTNSVEDCTRVPVPFPPAKAANDPRISRAEGEDFDAEMPEGFDPSNMKSVTAWCDLIDRPFGIAMLVDATQSGCQDSTDCMGKGVCVDATDRSKGCACNWGVYGAMCQGTCPGGMDTPCNNHGSCSSTGFCKCDFGWIGEACEAEGWEIGVMDKTSNNPQFNQGFPEAYTLSGMETPEITVIRGIQYTFVNGASGHPFYISSSEDGGGEGEITAGVINSQAQLDTTLGYTPASDSADLVYYQCFLHKNMGWKINNVNTQTCDAACVAPNGICNQATGNCQCLAGFTGTNCDQCDTNIWDNGDGKCNTCKLPRRLVAGECVDCMPGFFGTGCTSQCPQSRSMTCAGFGYCNEGPNGDGTCVCDSEHTGNDCSANVQPPDADIIFNIGAKVDGTSEFFGMGSPNAYTTQIKNSELSPSSAVFSAQQLVLRCYIRYFLQVDASCDNPMIITTNEKGGDATGIVEDQVKGNMACEGSRIEITPHIGLPSTVYYQSVKNEYMGNKITLLLPGVCPPQGCGAEGTCDQESGECRCTNGYTGLLCEIAPNAVAATDDSALTNTAVDPPTTPTTPSEATTVPSSENDGVQLTHNLLILFVVVAFSLLFC